MGEVVGKTGKTGRSVLQFVTRTNHYSTSCAMSWSIMYVRVRDDGRREAQLQSDVRGKRRGREDIVIVDERVPLGLAS